MPNVNGVEFPMCPGCYRRPITEDSPVSGVDGKTKVCNNCYLGEVTRSAIEDTDPTSMLFTGGSVEAMLGSLGPAKAYEKQVRKARSASYFHDMRVRNSNVPIPEPTQIKKWKIKYGRNENTGEIKASTENPSTYLSSFHTLDHETGRVSFGTYGTEIPPQYVQDHIRRVLHTHWKKYIQGGEKSS